jgi:XTP/dITP diphosphohydrolase
MKKIIIATRNKHKLLEIQSYLADHEYEFIGLEQFPEVAEIDETGSTLLENSLIKASTVHNITGLPAVGDDTGLEVDYLDGAPGVKSARFAGEDSNPQNNINLLLKKLNGVDEISRTARFRTVISIVYNGYEEWVEGIAEGIILKKPKGEGGFGYDPIFYYPPLNKTFAELSMAEKNKISHRGLALQKFRILLGKINLND